MTNSDLRERIIDILGEDEADEVILLEGDEFADGAIGLTDDGNVVYSYNMLVRSLTEKWGETTEQAAQEWIMCNTLPSLAYMKRYGLAPIILMDEFG